MASHLTTLIRRVKSVPYKLRNETSTFTSRLINLAEYLRYEKDYTEFEERKAKALLKAHNLDFLLEIKEDRDFEKAIQNLEIYKQRGYIRVCLRCGRTLTRTDSMRKGYGAECLSKRELLSGNEKLNKFFDLLGDDEDEQNTV